MNNLRYYEKLCRPPDGALKAIQGGRLKGKTDINPQWRIKAMTEVFGPVGIGWMYEITKLSLEPAGDEIAAFAEVRVRYYENEKWSEWIPGTGGSMFLEKEKAGLHVSDECFKMATTDALSVALKAIGVGGDVYAGMHDGSKYKDASPEQPTAKPPAKPPAKPEPMPTHDEYKGKEGEYPLPTKLRVNGAKTVKDIPAAKLEKTIEWAKSNGYEDLMVSCQNYLPF